MPDQLCVAAFFALAIPQKPSGHNPLERAFQTADTQPGPGPDGKLSPPIFHDNSYTVLTYAPH